VDDFIQSFVICQNCQKHGLNFFKKKGKLVTRCRVCGKEALFKTINLSGMSWLMKNVKEILYTSKSLKKRKHKKLSKVLTTPLASSSHELKGSAPRSSLIKSPVVNKKRFSKLEKKDVVSNKRNVTPSRVSKRGDAFIPSLNVTLTKRFSNFHQAQDSPRHIPLTPTHLLVTPKNFPDGEERKIEGPWIMEDGNDYESDRIEESTTSLSETMWEVDWENPKKVSEFHKRTNSHLSTLTRTPSHSKQSNLSKRKKISSLSNISIISKINSSESFVSNVSNESLNEPIESNQTTKCGNLLTPESFAANSKSRTKRLSALPEAKEVLEKVKKLEDTPVQENLALRKLVLDMLYSNDYSQFLENLKPCSTILKSLANLSQERKSSLSGLSQRRYYSTPTLPLDLDIMPNNPEREQRSNTTITRLPA